MRTIFENLLALLNQGEDAVLVTVAAARGSTPRGPGSQLLAGREGLRITLTDPAGSMLGTIAHVDTTTMNTLLHVDLADGGEALVPLADDWICSIDADARQIAMDIPPALMNMA